MQGLQIDGKPLWQIVAEKVSNEWNANDNCMLVVGATYPETIRQVREIVGDMTFLIPGIGAQGGDLETVCQYGMNDQCGLLVNSSRAIIYASDGTDFVDRAREEAQKLQKEMEALLS